MSLRFMALDALKALVIDSIGLGAEAEFPPPLDPLGPADNASKESWSLLSLLEVGWHMDTAAWKILRPPSHLSSRIFCTVSIVDTDVGSDSRVVTMFLMDSKSHCKILGKISWGRKDIIITATSFFLPDATWGRAWVPKPKIHKICFINDPLGQTHSRASSEHCLLLFCFSRFEKWGRTDMCENNDLYRPWLWVGQVDQQNMLHQWSTRLGQ